MCLILRGLRVTVVVSHAYAVNLELVEAELANALAPDKPHPMPLPTPLNLESHRTVPVSWTIPDVLYGLHVVDLQDLPEVC